MSYLDALNADLLPSNATALERALSLTGTRIFLVDMDVIRRGALSAECPVALLPILAWDRSVDVWRNAWPEAQQRAVVAGSLAYHKRKGTPAALESALGQLDFGTTLTEWFEYGGDPYFFRITVTSQGRPLTLDDYAAMKSIIFAAKNVRSMIDTVLVESELSDVTPLVAAWGARTAQAVTIYPTGTF